jgi:hypothetical protein
MKGTSIIFSLQGNFFKKCPKKHKFLEAKNSTDKMILVAMQA